MEELKDEADFLAAQPCQPVLVEARDVHLVDEHVARARRVEAGDETEQRGLAAARRPHDRQELSLRHLERQRVQDGERLGAAHHRF